MQVLGLDIGGANIKAASDDGKACCRAFPLWKKPFALTEFLSTEVLSRFQSPKHVALTMTGELCDCFDSKADGVRQILSAVEKTGIQPNVYALDGSFLSTDKARNHPQQVAASNWHALANFCRRFIENDPATDNGILIDLGSTSCDLIPLDWQRVLAIGTTDLTRMINRELVYTGVARTPVCAVSNTIRFRDRPLPVAEELFATMKDVYLILGDVPEQSGEFETADGRSLTVANSKRRLARMLCCDLDELEDGEIIQVAESFRAEQMNLLSSALSAHLADHGQHDPLVICAGSGSFLITQLLQDLNITRSLDLSTALRPSICASAPAYAVAKLLKESMTGEDS